MLARFSVLTRLKPHENSSLFSKMRVYDGESLKDTDPHAKTIQEYRDAAGVTEGMDGASTRFAYKILSETFNFDTHEVAADPVHLLYVIEQAVRREQMPEETESALDRVPQGGAVARATPSSSATRSRRPTWSPTTTSARTCSTATWPMPTPGSRTTTSRTPIPAS